MNDQNKEKVDIFSFFASVGAFLETNCVGSAAIARGVVAEAGGLTKENAPLISDLIEAGFLPGYRIRQGREGGVCREDAPEGPDPDKFDKAFLNLLLSTLAMHVPPVGQGSVTRGRVALEMGCPSGETEAKISRAISLKLCPGYSSKRGVGIFRLSTAETTPDAGLSSDGEPEAVPPVEATPVEATPGPEPMEATLEAEPATPAKRKSKKSKK